MTTLRHGHAHIPIEESSELAKQDQFGEYHPYPLPRIAVAEGLEGAQRGLTILHELIHHISERMGLGLSEAKTRVLEQELGLSMHQNRAYWHQLLQDLQ